MKNYREYSAGGFFILLFYSLFLVLHSQFSFLPKYFRNCVRSNVLMP